MTSSQSCVTCWKGRFVRRARNGHPCNDRRREALADSVAEFIAPGEADAALAVLGAFSESWDRMVKALVGFDLGEEKLFEALALVNVCIAESEKARAALRQDAVDLTLAASAGRRRIL